MSKKKFFLFIAMVFAGYFVLSIISPEIATAAEGAAKDAAEEGGVPEGAVNMIIESGYIGWFICVLSVITMALCIESFMSLKREKMLPEDLLADIETAIDEGNYEDAIDLCQAEDCLMTRVVGAGLNKMSMGVERMEDAIGEEADAQATMLNQKLGYINLIAGTAPMMGLLGTVSGMIEAFGEIARNPTANAADLAAGIYVALMTTLLGLIVAIPATIAFTYFRGKIVKILIVMSIINSEILDRFRSDDEDYE